MSPPTKTPHIHKLKRVRYKSGNTVFFCALPDCNYKSNPSLVLGKRSLCWRCGEPFIMNEYALRLAKPHCEGCHKPKSEVDKNEIESMVGNSLTETVPSLAERLTQTIQQAQPKIEEEEI